MRIFSFLFLLILTCLSSELVGQLAIERQVIASYGSFHTAGSLTVSATAGEAATETLNSISGTLVLTQGFQQADMTTTAIEDDRLEQIVNYQIYPNPTHNQLTVDVQTSDAVHLEIAMYDMRGRAIPELTREITGMGDLQQQLSLVSLASGRYLLMIKDLNGKGQISHKIEKR